MSTPVTPPPPPPPSRVRPASPPSRGSGGSRAWWACNRWALVGLPLALAAALAASSDRVYSWWWTAGLHRPATAAPGEPLVFDDVLDDEDGAHPFTVTLRLDGVTDASVGWSDETPLDLPPGTRALQVDLTLEADPDAALRVCSLAVRGTDGERYDYVPQVAGAFQPASPCVPPEAPGPWPDMGLSLEADPGEGTRPATWSVSPVVVLPDDVEPASVLVWWSPPDHAVLPVG